MGARGLLEVAEAKDPDELGAMERWEPAYMVDGYGVGRLIEARIRITGDDLGGHHLPHRCRNEAGVGNRPYRHPGHPP